MSLLFVNVLLPHRIVSEVLLFFSAALKSSLQDLPKPQITQKEELITVPSTDLSAREFVVYQHGLSILHLLIPQLQVSLVLVSVEQSSMEFRRAGSTGRRL